MRLTRIFVADPSSPEQVTRLQEELRSHLEVHPETRTTWLQSSASWSSEDGTMYADHVLSCAAEYETAETQRKSTRRR
jgi:hypothetical protein